ncbi:MAG TPA: CpaD family pilus assembly protein [Caulobacteraceae bacterium]|nr:CpaD family pilus assembly protein [Caulobacteraceae bacterium]
MSSNRGARSLFVVCIAALACACASTSKPNKDETAARLPTEQWAIAVNPSEDDVLLAPHEAGLSEAQQAALVSLVRRWRDGGGGPVMVKEPSGGQGQSYRSTAAVQDALEALGVDQAQIRISGYDAGPRPGAPIVVGYTRYEAKGPECGRSWKGFTNTFHNKVNSNFGCANTANIAAMIANPADLIAPRTSEPADAGRRETVLTKYREGTITSTTKDTQASGSVSAGVSQ